MRALVRRLTPCKIWRSPEKSSANSDIPPDSLLTQASVSLPTAPRELGCDRDVDSVCLDGRVRQQIMAVASSLPSPQFEMEALASESEKDVVSTVA